jgi:hypothetical protein
VSARSSLGLAIALLTAAALGACGKTPEPTSSGERIVATARPTASASSSSSASASAPAGPSGPTEVAWTAPARWKKVESPNRMRLATYVVPRAPGDAEDAELTVSRAGGTVAQNVERWAGQFEHRGASERREKRIGDLSVTLVEMHGAFRGMAMPGAPAQDAKAHWALLGAIVETAGSPTFFKLTGPERTVVAAKAELWAMIDGLRPK